jgi:hypothetical protein
MSLNRLGRHSNLGADPAHHEVSHPAFTSRRQPDDAEGPRTIPIQQLTRREWVAAAVGCALVAALFLSPALVTGRYLSPADMLYAYYPWRADPPAGWAGPSNSLLIDAVDEHEPWMYYAARQIQGGSLPLWMPDNMIGAPFIGNAQSAVFSPLNWPLFLWPDPAMLWVRAWLKLFITALGMYILARTVARVDPFGASLAVLPFTFGATMMVWLLHSLTGPLIWLPWLWWATALVVARPGPRSVAALAVFVALSLFGGHVETAYHMAEATGLFALFLAWQAAGGRAQRLRYFLSIIGLWSAAYLLGALVTAIQLLPFLEYSSQSMATLRRIARQDLPIWLPVRFAWTAISPDWYGNPARHNWWGTGVSYNDIINYSGVLPLLLAPLALLTRHPFQRRLAAFLVALIVLTLGVVYGAPLLFDAAMTIPGMRLVLNQRLVLVAEFALGLLAALGMATLRQRAAGSLRAVLVVLGGSVAGWMGLGVVVPWLLASSFFQVPTESALPNQVWQDAALRAGGWLLVSGGVVALLIGWMKSGHRRARLLLGLLPLLLVGDLWTAYAGYLPTVAPPDYFPATAATTFLQQAPGPFRTVAAADVLFPNTNLMYGFADLRGNDALEPPLYYDLTTGANRALTETTPGGLKPSPLWNLLNVRYVLAAPGDDPNYAVDLRQETTTGKTVDELAGAAQPGQTFVAGHDYLAGVQVLGATYARTLHGPLLFHLKTDPQAAQDLITQELDPTRLANNDYWTIPFPPIARSQGRGFYFYLEAPQTPVGQGGTIWYSETDVYQAGSRMAGREPVPGDLAFRTLFANTPDASWFRRVLDGGAGGASVFENQRVLPRAWLVHQAEVQTDAATQPRRLRDAGFAADQTAVINAPLPAQFPLPAAPPPGAADAVTITRYAPETVEIATESAAAGLLILSDQFFPGWEATLDNQATPIFPADHALRSVYVPAGTHTVRFHYSPGSFWWGALLTGLGLGVLLLLGACPRSKTLFGNKQTNRGQ